MTQKRDVLERESVNDVPFYHITINRRELVNAIISSDALKCYHRKELRGAAERGQTQALVTLIKNRAREK